MVIRRNARSQPRPALERCPDRFDFDFDYNLIPSASRSALVHWHGSCCHDAELPHRHVRSSYGGTACSDAWLRRRSFTHPARILSPNASDTSNTSRLSVHRCARRPQLRTHAHADATCGPRDGYVHAQSNWKLDGECVQAQRHGGQGGVLVRVTGLVGED
jgi:hypothetical protein